MIELKKLSPDDGRDIYDMLQAMPKNENGLMNHANGMTYDEYKEWLIRKQQESEQTGLVDGWKVPSVTYWLYVNDVPVGFGNVRNFLTDALKKAGGNIGYGIVPMYRGKGYGNMLLRLLLKKAHEAGIDKALLTINSVAIDAHADLSQQQTGKSQLKKITKNCDRRRQRDRGKYLISPVRSDRLHAVSGNFASL